MLAGNNAQVLIFQLKKTSILLLHFVACPLFFCLIIDTDDQTENALSFTADMMLKEDLEYYIILDHLNRMKQELSVQLKLMNSL